MQCQLITSSSEPFHSQNTNWVSSHNWFLQTTIMCLPTWCKDATNNVHSHKKRLYLRIAPFSEGTQNTRVDITILWYTSSFSKICYLSCKQGFRDWLSLQGWNVSHGLLYLFSISLGLSPNFSLKASCRCTHIMCPCRSSQKTHLQILDLISESTKPIDHIIIFINSPDTHLQDTSKQLLQSK